MKTKVSGNSAWDNLSTKKQTKFIADLKKIIAKAEKYTKIMNDMPAVIEQLVEYVDVRNDMERAIKRYK